MTRGEGSASSGSATVWTRMLRATADESQGAFEHGRVADHQRPGQIVQPRLEPAPHDHLGTDARDIAHRQADQRAVLRIHASRLRWLRSKLMTPRFVAMRTLAIAACLFAVSCRRRN